MCLTSESRLLSRNAKVKIYKTIILPVVLYGLSHKGKSIFRVFENRVIRRIFGPKGVEVTGEWRKLHNEELHILCTPPRISLSRSSKGE
jgi:hypothetical protein